MSIDLKELLAKPYDEQRRHITFTLGHVDSCMIVNAIMKNVRAHSADEPLLRQLRHLVDIKTAVDYHNRSEQITKRIRSRPDSDQVWSEIYNQYIPGIVALTTAGDASGAWAAIMTMLAQVESEY
jgi:hypothetical protein